MPIYLRKFYLTKLLEVKKEEKKEIEKASKKQKSTIYKPNIKRR